MLSSTPDIFVYLVSATVWIFLLTCVLHAIYLAVPRRTPVLEAFIKTATILYFLCLIALGITFHWYYTPSP